MATALMHALHSDSPALLETLLTAIGQLEVPEQMLFSRLLACQATGYLMEQGKTAHLTCWLTHLHNFTALQQQQRFALMMQTESGLTPLYAGLINQQHAAVAAYLQALSAMAFSEDQLLSCLANDAAGLHNLLYIPVALGDSAGLTLLLDALATLPLSNSALFHYLGDEYQASLPDGPALAGKTAFQLAIGYGNPDLITTFADRLRQLPLASDQRRQLLWSYTRDGNSALTCATQLDQQHLVPASISALFETLIAGLE